MSFLNFLIVCFNVCKRCIKTSVLQGFSRDSVKYLWNVQARHLAPHDSFICWFSSPPNCASKHTPVSEAEVITASSAESFTPEETSEPGLVLGNKFLKDRTGERWTNFREGVELLPSFPWAVVLGMTLLCRHPLEGKLILPYSCYRCLHSLVFIQA